MDREALNIRLGVEEDECWKDARQHHSLQPSKKAMLNALGVTIFCIVFTIGAGAASAAGITQAAAFAILSAIIAALSAIRYVREKIDRPFGRNSLQTVRGVGYRICDEA